MKLFDLSTFKLAIAAVVISACTPESPETQLEQSRQSEFEKGAAALEECRKALCSDLNLSFASLEDYAVLNEMTHVTALELRYNTFESLEDISAMQQLEELRITATGIREVAGFADFEKLTVLHIRSGLAEDVRPTLMQMPNLKDIAINLPDDGDISFARELQNLESVFLLGGKILDLDPLAGHPNLKNLYMHSGLPNDLSALLEIPNLQTLTVFDRVEQEDSSGVIGQLKMKGITVKLFRSVVY